jgi:hypothetical protein
MDPINKIGILRISHLRLAIYFEPTGQDLLTCPTSLWKNPGFALLATANCLISLDAILRKMAFPTGSTLALSGGTRSVPSAGANSWTKPLRGGKSSHHRV